MADALREAAAKMPAILPKAHTRLICVILGLESWDRMGWSDKVGAISGILLIIYNGARALLTFFVTQLRDEEQVSNHTPRWRSPRPSSRSVAEAFELTKLLISIARSPSSAPIAKRGIHRKQREGHPRLSTTTSPWLRCQAAPPRSPRHGHRSRLGC